jgi:hypothetical protein
MSTQIESSIPSDLKDSTIRNKLSPGAKTLLTKYCQSEDVHSTLFVTYKDVAERIFGWLNMQNAEVWNQVIEVLETELKASANVCFTGRLGRLVSALDGFHSGVRITISTSDQISNRVLKVIEKFKAENLTLDLSISDNDSSTTNLSKLKEKILQELKDLELSDEDAKAWMETVNDMEL